MRKVSYLESLRTHTFGLEQSYEDGLSQPRRPVGPEFGLVQTWLRCFRVPEARGVRWVWT
jgi:hypothetical protein